MSTSRRRESDEDDSHEHERRQSNWKLQREISIPTLVMLAANLGAIIWWAATTVAKVESIEKAIMQERLAQHAVDAKQEAQLARIEAQMYRIIENGRK